MKELVVSSDPTHSSSPSPESTSVQVASRLEHLRNIEALGIDPWGGRFDGAIAIQKIREMPLNPENPPKVKATGRIVLRRPTGKLHFLEIRDWSGHRIGRELKGEGNEGVSVDAWSSYIQVAIGKAQVGETGWALAQELDLGDLIGVEGSLKLTKTGELTIFVESLTMLCKSLEPHPDKWGGMQDMEFRLRHRYLDLIYNPETLERATQRITIIRTIRNYLDNLGFCEVENPVLHAVAGGAAARPFTTHHNTLDLDLFLRIALELHLKRLLVGGMERVYEISRVFRNEGISPKHNPEFTMMELYQAYGDYRSMMDITEGLILACVDAIGGGHVRNWGEKKVDLTPPWKRAKYGDLFQEYLGVAMDDVAGVREAAQKHKVELGNKEHDVLVHDLFEKSVEYHLEGPVFVYDYPAALCPLTKRQRGNPNIAERFELYIHGMELANAYTELNDPITQEATFRKQLVGLSEEDSMAKMDDDFVRALRFGMPPAGGLGIGIDRLVMLLTNTQTIRDVILFPLLRPEKK